MLCIFDRDDEFYRVLLKAAADARVAELAQHRKVRAWFAGAHHDELPEADQRHYLATLNQFLGGVGKNPDELVASCFLEKEANGERSPAQKARAEINAWIDERVQRTGCRGKDAVQMANVVRGFLSHNGVLIQGPAWTKGML